MVSSEEVSVLVDMGSVETVNEGPPYCVQDDFELIF